MNRLFIIFIFLFINFLRFYSQIEQPALKSTIQDTTLKTKSTCSENELKNSEKASVNQLKNIYYRSTKLNTQRNLSSDDINYVNQLLDIIKENDSYNYHFFSYVFSDYSKENFKHLLETKKLNSQSKDLDYYFVCNYEIYKDDEKKAVYLKELFKNNLIDQELAKYAKHLMSSVDENSTIIVHGKDDFLSLLYLQDVLKVNRDIKVLSLDLLRNEDYRNKLRKEGYNIPKNKLIDINFFEEFIKSNESKNINISLTMPREYIEKLGNNWYFKGLCISNKNFSTKINEYIFEKLNINKDFYIYNKDKTRKLSSNYLPFLIILSESYSNSNNEVKAKQISDIVEKIKIQSSK